MNRRPLFLSLILGALASSCGPAETSTSATDTGGSSGASGASGSAGSAGSAASAGTAGAAGSGATGGSSMSGGSGGSTDPRFAPLIDAIEKERVELGSPGVAAAVIEDGKVTFARGFGSKDPNSMVPVEATTLFRIGSVNKMLTTAALLKHVGEGTVDLDAPVTTYAPDFHFKMDASWAPTIKVEHLLTHTSAMLDYLLIDVPAAQKTDSALSGFFSGEDSGDFSLNNFLMAPAGEFWNYSNPNFYLAGLIAETQAGKPYRQAMKDDVFTPLGMDLTFFLGSEVIADGDYAIGKSSYPGVPMIVKPDSYDNAWARPAGYASSSVLDLAKFVGFLLDGNDAVMPKALSDEMQTPKVPTQVFLDLLDYGYGIQIQHGAFLGGLDKFYELEIVEHGGDIPGFAASVMFVPAQRFGFITLANTDGAHFAKSLVAALTTLADLPPQSPAPDLTVDPSTFDQYTGTYQDSFNAGEIIVTKEGDSLKVSMPAVDQANVPYDPVLEPIVGNNFRLTIQGIKLPVTFIADASGTSRYFRTRAFVGTRPMAPPAPPKNVLPGGRERLITAIQQTRPTAAERLLRPLQ
jgi:CubicO group peptidase (beta-lactamase class C family)